MNHPPLTRSDLEDVFESSELITVPEHQAGSITDPDARDVLRTLGIPLWDNPWIDVDDRIPERWERVGGWDVDLTERYDRVPPEAGRWIGLAVIPYDRIAFDPETGRVYCLAQDGEIYLFSSSLRSFVYFLYLLQLERPHFDIDMETEAEFEPEAARQRTEAAMRAADPEVLDNARSRWHDILEYIVDPDAHHH